MLFTFKHLWLWPLTVVLVFGVNFIFWGLVGLVRLVSDKFFAKNPGAKRGGLAGPPLVESWLAKTGLPGPLTAEDVAILVPAHNEELVIAATLSALLKFLPRENLFLVSDGSTDKTAEIARSFGVKVLELATPRGKAGALESCLTHYKILQRFRTALFVDADTRLSEDYLEKALPFFENPRTAAVAGYARTMWEPKKFSWIQMLFVGYRDRVYFFSQTLIKFGQTWKYLNVTPIVPGFASIYNTNALKKMNLNPKGLVIEDFNMTFEVHHKNLGAIAHNSSVMAFTQDPDNERDYYRQIKRWHLGFWQTIRLHGFWPSKFWVALLLTLIEVTVTSLLFLLLPLFLAFWLFTLAASYFAWPHVLQFAFFFQNLFPAKSLGIWLLLGVFLPDYLLSLVMAITQKRPQYLILGLTFPFIRFLDAAAFLGAIPKAFFVNSTGRWSSPTRRAV